MELFWVKKVPPVPKKRSFKEKCNSKWIYAFAGIHFEQKEFPFSCYLISLLCCGVVNIIVNGLEIIQDFVGVAGIEFRFRHVGLY